MWLDLPWGWVVILNCVGIPIVHLGVSWAVSRMPASVFDPGFPLFRVRQFERGGRCYQRVFRIRAWKGLLPDAAPWFGGEPKRNLAAADPETLRRFAVETCRGEAAHWLQGALIAGFVVWNPPPAALVVGVYAVLSNLPCILTLRFVRARIARVVTGRL